MEGGADDDVAEVIGAGDRRGDHGEGERGAFVGAGEVDLAGEIDGVVAGAGAGCGGADLGGGGAARVCLLCEAGVAGVGGGGEGGVGAVGDALQGRREARRGGDGEGAEVLVAVGAGEFEREGAVGGGGGVGDTRSRMVGLKGAWSRDRRAPPGPELRVKNWVEVCSGAGRSQGVKVLLTGYVPHWVGVARRPRSEPKKCMLKSEKGLWGRFWKEMAS